MLGRISSPILIHIRVSFLWRLFILGATYTLDGFSPEGSNAFGGVLAWPVFCGPSSSSICVVLARC